MMSFLRRKYTALLSIVLLTHIFLMSVLPASAGFLSPSPPMPNPSSFFSDGEKRYHIDPQAVQDQGETFNTSANKQPTPDVSIFFNPSDPKAGEKISAKAFPMYFSGSEKDMYYTWYLKHSDCGLTNVPTPTQKALCDRDANNKITVEDWKIEAMQIIAQHGFDKAEANYASDSDNDAYKARFGGDKRVGVANHCYIMDSTDGKKYELGNSGEIKFDCRANETAICLEGETSISPTTFDVPGSDPLLPVPGSSNTAISFDATGTYNISGYPYCNALGVPVCSVGTPRCVTDTQANPLGAGRALNSCSGLKPFNPFCSHLFPNAPGFTSGDGTFAQDEEKFWGTSPQDPDTADNGNKDEANVTGLGQTTFDWNYANGDQVGLVVEGTSMISTKYDDSSSMIMWAFSKNDCPLSLASSKGSFQKQIKGYQVTMLSADLDLNKCLERNLVDPTQGGQATNLDVSVTANPDSPINDESFVVGPPPLLVKTSEGGGDVVSAEASVANSAKGTTEILFDWSVEMSNNPQFLNSGALVSKVVTTDLQNLKLLGNIKGTALDTISVRLDIMNQPTVLLAGNQLSSYLTNNIGYIRFTAKASENFSTGVARKGKSDVIVKFTSTGKKISAYKVDPVPVGTAMQVKLSTPPPPATGVICNDDPLDRISCRIIKNEIVGLRVDPTDLSNFEWTINGSPLKCTRSVVSQDCEKDALGNITVGQQNFVNFFPVSGNVGDTYTVTLNANDVKTGKTVTLTRTFHVIEPALAITSADSTTAWPKLIGQYKDINGTASPCPNALCNQFSESIFEGFSGEALKFKSVFIPSFLASRALRQWTIDGVAIADVVSVNALGVTEYTITYGALKVAPDVYNIALSASLAQPQNIRQALRDIWNISPLESTEIHFSATAQVELKEPGFAQGTLQGTKKYLAALASYIPASVMFSFRIVLSVMLLLFTARFFLVMLPERSLVQTPGGWRKRT